MDIGIEVIVMRIALCDDDEAELLKVKRLVDGFMAKNQSHEQISCRVFNDGDELLSNIRKDSGYDLLILDILMPGMNGLELAAEIRCGNADCKIIFLTSSPEFALHSYKVNAFFYLLKPFLACELESLLEKALYEVIREKSASIVVKETGKLTRVKIHTIQYVECIRHTICFHLRNHQVLHCSGTMNEFCEILLSDKKFTKCHKSFIVNMDYVTSITSKDFIMADKTMIPISRKSYKQIKDSYINYFFDQGKEAL